MVVNKTCCIKIGKMYASVIQRTRAYIGYEIKMAEEVFFQGLSELVHCYVSYSIYVSTT